jgi:hypothetical protein
MINHLEHYMLFKENKRENKTVVRSVTDITNLEE